MPQIPADFFSNINISYYYGSLIHCTAQWKDFDTVCSYSKFYYILDGECVIEIGGVKHKGQKGRLFLIPAGTKHSFYHTDNNFIKKYWFHFSLDLGGQNFFKNISLPPYIDVGSDASLKKLFKEILAHAKSAGLHDALFLKSKVLGIVARYIALSKTDDMILSDPLDIDLALVMEFIKSNLKRRITVGELADMAHLHPNYFIKVFKEKTGISPAKYVNRIRMERAKSLLENSTAPISEIMETVGFDDLSHFSKCFKRYCGYSPKQFRFHHDKWWSDS